MEGIQHRSQIRFELARVQSSYRMVNRCVIVVNGWILQQIGPI